MSHGRIFIAALAMGLLGGTWLWAWHYSRASWGIDPTTTAAGLFDVAAALPAARTEAGGAACGGHLYVVGGIGGLAETYQDAYRYSPATDRWQRLEDLPVALNHPGVVCADAELYVVGGFGPLGLRLRGFMFARWDPRAALYRYDRDGGHWIPLAPLPEARGAGGVAATPGALWYVGGIRPDYSLADDLFRYDLAANRWTREARMPTARDHLRMESIDGTLYAISGRKDDLRSNLGAVERYDLASDRWEAVAPHPVPRGGLGSAVLGGTIYTFGGESPWTCHSGVEAYDPALDRWREIGELPEARHGIVAGVIGERIHMVSGGRHPRISVSRIHRVFRPHES